MGKRKNKKRRPNRATPPPNTQRKLQRGASKASSSPLAAEPVVEGRDDVLQGEGQGVPVAELAEREGVGALHDAHDEEERVTEVGAGADEKDAGQDGSAEQVEKMGRERAERVQEGHEGGDQGTVQGVSSGEDSKGEEKLNLEEDSESREDIEGGDDVDRGQAPTAAERQDDALNETESVESELFGGGDDGTEDTAESVGEDAADYAANDGSEDVTGHVGEDVAERAGGDAVEPAGRDAAERAGEDGAAGAAEPVGEDAAEHAVDDGSKYAAEAASEDAAEAGDKDAAEPASEDAAEAGDKDAAEPAGEDAVERAGDDGTADVAGCASDDGSGNAAEPVREDAAEDVDGDATTVFDHCGDAVEVLAAPAVDDAWDSQGKSLDVSKEQSSDEDGASSESLLAPERVLSSEGGASAENVESSEASKEVPDGIDISTHRAVTVDHRIAESPVETPGAASPLLGGDLPMVEEAAEECRVVADEQPDDDEVGAHSTGGEEEGSAEQEGEEDMETFRGDIEGPIDSVARRKLHFKAQRAFSGPFMHVQRATTLARSASTPLAIAEDLQLELDEILSFVMASTEGMNVRKVADMTVGGDGDLQEDDECEESDEQASDEEDVGEALDPAESLADLDNSDELGGSESGASDGGMPVVRDNDVGAVNPERNDSAAPDGEEAAEVVGLQGESGDMESVEPSEPADDAPQPPVSDAGLKADGEGRAAVHTACDASPAAVPTAEVNDSGDTTAGDAAACDAAVGGGNIEVDSDVAMEELDSTPVQAAEQRKDPAEVHGRDAVCDVCESVAKEEDCTSPPSPTTTDQRDDEATSTDVRAAICDDMAKTVGPADPCREDLSGRMPKTRSHTISTFDEMPGSGRPRSGSARIGSPPSLDSLGLGSESPVPSLPIKRPSLPAVTMEQTCPPGRARAGSMIDKLIGKKLFSSGKKKDSKDEEKAKSEKDKKSKNRKSRRRSRKLSAAEQEAMQAPNPPPSSPLGARTPSEDGATREAEKAENDSAPLSGVIEGVPSCSGDGDDTTVDTTSCDTTDGSVTPGRTEGDITPRLDDESIGDHMISAGSGERAESFTSPPRSAGDPLRTVVAEQSLSGTEQAAPGTDKRSSDVMNGAASTEQQDTGIVSSADDVPPAVDGANTAVERVESKQQEEAIDSSGDVCEDPTMGLSGEGEHKARDGALGTSGVDAGSVQEARAAEEANAKEERVATTALEVDSSPDKAKGACSLKKQGSSLQVSDAVSHWAVSHGNRVSTPRAEGPAISGARSPHTEREPLPRLQDFDLNEQEAGRSALNTLDSALAEIEEMRQRLERIQPALLDAQAALARQAHREEALLHAAQYYKREALRRDETINELMSDLKESAPAVHHRFRHLERQRGAGAAGSTPGEGGSSATPPPHLARRAAASTDLLQQSTKDDGEGDDAAGQSEAVMSLGTLQRMRPRSSVYRLPPRIPSFLDVKTEQDMYKVVMLQSMVRVYLAKKLQRRARVERELLVTEENYVKALRVIVSVFLKPLQDQEILGEKEVRAIFSDVQELLKHHRIFLSILKREVVEWGNVGHVFLEQAVFLREYTAYVNNYNNAISTLAWCMQNPLFANFIQSCERIPRVKKMDLSSLLIMPIQRVPRYKMLLAQIMKHARHKDTVVLRRAIDHLEEVTMYINEQKRGAEELERVCAEVKQIIGKNGKSISPSRLLFKGTVFEKGRPLQLYLFNTALALTKETKVKSETMYKLRYKEAVVTLQRIESYEEDSKKRADGDSRFCFRIVAAKRRYELAVGTETSRKVWLKHLHNAMSQQWTHETKPTKSKREMRRPASDNRAGPSDSNMRHKMHAELQDAKTSGAGE